MFRENIVPQKKDYFDRDEGHGKLIISNTGIDDSIIVNSTAMEILKMIDNKKTIKDIADEISNNYPEIEYKTIYEDLENTLKNFYKRDIISFESEDIMEEKNILSENNLCRIEKLSEIDFKKITNYLSTRSKKIQYVNSYNHLEYTEIMIRNRLFKYIEEYFALINNENETIGLVSFCKNTTP